MDVRIRKTVADLSGRKLRTLFTLLGLIIGMWGLGTVLIANRVLSTDLPANFERTIPPDLEISAAPLGAAVIAEMAGFPQVLALENRRRLAGRIATGEDSWLPLILFVVEDFEDMAVARFFPEDGAWPPPDGAMLIERDGLSLMRFFGSTQPRATQGHGSHGTVRSGAPRQRIQPDQFRIQLEADQDIVVPRAGKVFDPGQAPSRMELMVYGYVTLATALQWQEGPIRDHWLIRTEVGLDDPARRAALLQRIEDALDRTGVADYSLSVRPRDQHPHQFQLNTILFLLLGLGIMGLALSAVLVINLVNALLTNQIRQIGALKAIGASRAQVAMIYLGGMLILGLVAAIITLPMAIASGYRLAGGLAFMLNFEIFSKSLSPTFYLAMAAGGAMFPVLAALVPVRHWTSVPVRSALDHFGVESTAVRGSFIDHWPIPAPLSVRLGVRNALRKPARFLLCAATLGVGALVFLMAMNLRSSLLFTAQLEEQAMTYDLAVAFERRTSHSEFAWIDQFPWSESTEMMLVDRVAMTKRPATGTPSFRLIAIPAGDTASRPLLLDGRWTRQGEIRGVVASHRFLKQYPEMSIGTTFAVRLGGEEREFELVGTVKAFGPSTLYVDADAYRRMNGIDDERLGDVALVTFAQDSDLGLREASQLLEEHFAMTGIGVRGISFSRLAARVIRNHLLVIEVMLGIVAFIMLLVSALGLASGLATSVVERTREIGVLRAVGARGWTVFKILAVEALFVAVVAWLAAVLISIPASRWMNAWFGSGIVEYPFDYAMSGAGVALSAVTVFVMAGVSTWAASHGARRQSVREAVSYE